LGKTTVCLLGYRMNYVEMDNEQRRQLIDAQQAYATWWPANVALRGIGSMHWQRTKGARYLIEKHGTIRKSLGRETPTLARKKEAFDSRKKALKARATASGKRLKRIADVNKALRLGRIRRIVAAILRELDARGLLGSHVIVVGTNALHAYEANYGVLIGAEHVATIDADLLWDARKSLQLVSKEIGEEGLLGILRSVDPSFTADYGFNATNDEGYIVDLLTPEINKRVPLLEGLVGNDLEASAMPGLIWLLNAPPLEEVVIADDGWPVRMVVPDPRTFALHKLWVSKQASRRPVSKRKVADHAALLADLITSHSNDRFTAKSMPWLPPALKALLKDIKSAKAA
jgi:hypothetical protein